MMSSHPWPWLRAAAAIVAAMSIILADRPAAAEAAAGPPLVLERSIALENVGGRIDHMAIDLGRKRLIVAELGNGTVEAIDLNAGKVVHRIEGLRSPQGVGYAPSADMILVASAGDGTVRLFRGDDLAPLGVVPLGDDADNIRIDPRSGSAVVGFGKGGLATIDPATKTKTGEIKLPAHPEGFQLGPRGGRAFVNLPDAHEIAVVDLAGSKPPTSWKVPGLDSNFPMAIDQEGGTVAAVFRSPPRLVLLDAGSGAVTANIETCGDADDIFFDAKRRRLYVSCGAGAVAVFERDPGSAPRQLARVPTASGARTSLFVPELDKLYVAARAGLLGSRAAILVMRPAP
jgi:hypothetical protein